MSADSSLRYRPGKTITLDPATLHYLKDNPQLLDEEKPGFLQRVNTFLEWMQQWSIKVVVVLYVIMLTAVLYWKWTTDSNLLKADRYVALSTASHSSTYAPIIESVAIPQGFPIPFDFLSAKALIEGSTETYRTSKTGYFRKDTPWLVGSPSDIHSDESLIYQASLQQAFRDPAESSSILRVSGKSKSVESMQYKHVRSRIEQISGITQVVLMNSSSINACYPYSYIEPLSGQCRVNHTNASRAEFPLFGNLVDADFRPFSVTLQPGQSLDIPALWMYELIAESHSVAIVREFPYTPLTAIDDLASRAPFQGEFSGWENERVLCALSLFVAHLERRLSFPDLIGNLNLTRYLSVSNASEFQLTSCNVDGIISSGTTLGQYIRRQASAAADTIQQLDQNCQLLAAQDFIENLVASSLKGDISVETFLRAYLQQHTKNALSN